MSEDGGAACCRCCSSFIFTSGLTALFMWLSLRPYKPTCSIQDFYVPALNKSDNSQNNNHTIFFNLKLQNRMKDKGVNYANISMTFFYYQNESRLPIGNFTVPGFYQGHGKNAHRKEVVPVAGVPWAAATAAVSNGSTVKFRVSLTTRVKFKIMFWYTKRRSLVVGGDVMVDGGGKKTGKKAVKLKSGVPPDLGGNYWVRVGTVAFLTFLMI